MTDDLSLWGATTDDERVLPRPDMRRIGERLFVRPRGMEAGRAMRLPLRLDPALMKRAIAAGDGTEQLGVVVAELGDDLTRAEWDGLDSIDRMAVAKRYFDEATNLFGLALGES